MSAWIDFKALRAQLDFEQVLRHYGVEVKRKGSQHLGYCPLPNHNGKRNSPSFSANFERGIFQCFGCGAKGNVIDFAALMQKLNPESGEDVRTAALALQERFMGVKPSNAKPAKKHIAPQLELPQPEPSQSGLPVVVNAPLDFELKHLDGNHPYLDKRGFSKETVAHFGLGHCSKGMLAGRIAIPIHNGDGKLVAYAGRIVDDTRINEENPRYKFPPKREHKGSVYETHKSELVYNAHRLRKPVNDLIVVEGFPSVWWLTQMEFPDAVALMGSSMSEAQAKIVLQIVPASGRVWMISNGDEAGERCAHSVFERIAPERFVRWLRLDDKKQPTDYPGGWYRARIGK